MKVSNQSLVLSTFLLAATLLIDAEASQRGMVRNGRVQRKRKLINIVTDMVGDANIKQQSAMETFDTSDIEFARSLMEMSMSMSMSMPMETSDTGTEVETETETGEAAGEETTTEEGSSPTTEEGSSSETGGDEGEATSRGTDIGSDQEGKLEEETGDESTTEARSSEESSASSRNAAFAAAAATIVLPMLF